jgi:hypothetical protein
MAPGTLVKYCPHWATQMGIKDSRLYVIISYDPQHNWCQAITSSTGEITKFWTEDLVEC